LTLSVGLVAPVIVPGACACQGENSPLTPPGKRTECNGSCPSARHNLQDSDTAPPEPPKSRCQLLICGHVLPFPPVDAATVRALVGNVPERIARAAAVALGIGRILVVVSRTPRGRGRRSDPLPRRDAGARVVPRRGIRHIGSRSPLTARSASVHGRAHGSASGRLGQLAPSDLQHSVGLAQALSHCRRLRLRLTGRIANTSPLQRR